MYLVAIAPEQRLGAVLAALRAQPPASSVLFSIAEDLEALAVECGASERQIEESRGEASS
jgi:hypothetical protein